MVDSTGPLLRLWENRIEEGEVEMELYEDLRNYSADVISRACFGSSYLRGKEMFSKLRLLQNSLSKPNLFAEITGFRSKQNKYIYLFISYPFIDFSFVNFSKLALDFNFLYLFLVF